MDWHALHITHNRASAIATVVKKDIPLHVGPPTSLSNHLVGSRDLNLGLL